MELPVCKCCGQTLPGALDFNGVRLTPMQKRIVDRVHKAGPAGATLEMLTSYVWANDINGGPLCARNSIWVQVSKANQRLAAIGKRVRADKRGGKGAFYTLEAV